MEKKKLWHLLFLVSIFFKGLDGIAEFLGGLVFLFIKNANVEKFTSMLFQHELTEDPNDMVVNYLINAIGGITRGTEIFAAIFLLVHGVIKISIVAGLYLRKLWVYPLAEVILALFIIYQVYRFTNTLSILLLFLTVVDFFIIILIWIEYRRLRSLNLSDLNSYKI